MGRWTVVKAVGLAGKAARLGGRGPMRDPSWPSQQAQPAQPAQQAQQAQPAQQAMRPRAEQAGGGGVDGDGGWREPWPARAVAEARAVGAVRVGGLV